MLSYEVASNVSTDRAIRDAPCESEMQGYAVASDVSTDTGDR